MYVFKSIRCQVASYLFNGKTNSRSLRKHLLPIFFHLAMCPYEISLIPIAYHLVSSLFSYPLGNRTDESSRMPYLEDSLPKNILVFYLMQSFNSLFCHVSWVLSAWVVFCFYNTGKYQGFFFLILSGVTSYNVLSAENIFL